MLQRYRTTVQTTYTQKKNIPPYRKLFWGGGITYYLTAPAPYASSIQKTEQPVVRRRQSTVTPNNVSTSRR